MAKHKLKIDPLTQAKQAVNVFKNLQQAIGMLSEMVKHNQSLAEKQVKTLEEKEEKALNEALNNQTSTL